MLATDKLRSVRSDDTDNAGEMVVTNGLINNQRGGMNDADSYGGVSTAEDEAILEYVRVK